MYKHLTITNEIDNVGALILIAKLEMPMRSKNIIKDKKEEVRNLFDKQVFIKYCSDIK